MTRLNGFKFVTTLFLVFKKIEGDDKTRYDNYYSYSRAETNIYESHIDDVFNQSTLQVDQTHKKFKEKVEAEFLI